MRLIPSASVALETKTATACISQREVRRHHYEEPVNVQTVAGQGHFQEFDALRSQDFLSLTGALDSLVTRAR